MAFNAPEVAARLAKAKADRTAIGSLSAGWMAMRTMMKKSLS